MELSVFLRGLAIGFGIAAPVGPIGVLCIRRTLRTAAAAAPSARRRGLLSAWASTFVLTLTNPTTIVSFAAVFAGLGLGGRLGGYGPAALMVLGVFLGSALWWLLLSTGVAFFRSAVTGNRLRWVNRTAAAIITAFGITALAALLV